jgi:hypothetical protein
MAGEAQKAAGAPAHIVGDKRAASLRPVHGTVQQREPAMPPFMQRYFHSASVRAEMRALQVQPHRLPVGTMMAGMIAGADTASAIGMLMCL